MKNQLTLSNFESQLGEVLLSRGYDYIENVVDLKVAGNDEYNQWRAKVQGSETYRVVIQTDVVTDAIRFSSCNCPFDGPICKHQVAVLYSIQMTDNETAEKPKVPLDKVGDLLSKVTFEELKDYIKSYTDNDNEFKNHLLASFAAKTCKTVADFKGVIEQSLRPLKRKHGFIHFQEFNNAVKPIESLVESASQCMMQNDLQTGVNIYLAILEKLIPALEIIDDSDGILSSIIDNTFLGLSLVKEHHPPKSILSALTKYAVKKSTSPAMQGMDHGWQFAELAAEVASADDEALIKKMVTALKKEGKGNDFIEWYSGERAANVLVHYFFNNKSEEEVNDFVEQNLKYYSIRKIAINYAIRKKNLDKALALIEDGINEAKAAKHQGTVNELRKISLTIYLQKSDIKNIVSTAEQLFYESYGDLNSYRILKKHLPEDEWLKKSKAYKQKLEKNHEYPSLAEILKEEDNPRELLRILTVSNNIGLIQQYDDSIPQELRPQLQEIYFSLITGSLEARPDRSNYRYNAGLLKNMLGKFDDMLTIGFANLLRERYKARKALLEELAVIPKEYQHKS